MSKTYLIKIVVEIRTLIIVVWIPFKTVLGIGEKELIQRTIIAIVTMVIGVELGTIT